MMSGILGRRRVRIWKVFMFVVGCEELGRLSEEDERWEEEREVVVGGELVMFGGNIMNKRRIIS